MEFVTGLLVYFLSWWMIWFMLLPIGVVTQEESGEGVVPGTPKSAPARSRHLIYKAGAATVLAGIVLAVIYYFVIQ